MICIPCKNGRQHYVAEIETRYQTLEPMDSSGKFSQRANAILVQNQGSCNVLIDQGFTLEPGQSHTFESSSDLGVVKVDCQIWFDEATTRGTLFKRLEIVLITTNLTGRGYYVDTPTLA